MATRSGPLLAGGVNAHEAAASRNDTLARLGGDEFVALITVVRNRREQRRLPAAGA